MPILGDDKPASDVQEMDRSAWCYGTTTTHSHIPDAVRATEHLRWSEQGAKMQPLRHSQRHALRL
jgi:hypothetical protein